SESQIGKYRVRLTTRSGTTSGNKFSIQRLVSRRDEAIDLTSAQVAEALAKTQQDYHEHPESYRRTSSPEVPGGPFIRAQRSPARGLLLVYPIDPKELPTSPGSPLMSFAFSFPGSTTAVPVEYLVNNVYWEQEFGGE